VPNATPLLEIGDTVQTSSNAVLFPTLSVIMNPQIEAVFDDAENRYLKPEELDLISQYTHSIPARLETYQSLRDYELEVMQWAANQLQAEMPLESVENLERSIKNGLLLLRCCAMAMLVNDQGLIRDRFLVWAGSMTTVYGSHLINTTLYRLINHRLNQVLEVEQMKLLMPMLAYAQNALSSDFSQPIPEENGMAIGG
jgi:Phycobilisome protein